jgi:hypothetical protein
MGVRVDVIKNPMHEHAVYKLGSREQEITAEPMGVQWNGYYRDLQNSGAILIVGGSDASLG